MSTHTPDSRLPARMRDHELEAELRESPDLHKLAQVFIGMALDRAKSDKTTATSTAACRGGEVESDTQHANG
ncbi:hypothetical protein ACQR35_12015 [Pseudarthrobacter sp. J1738]|uniref:hypothetical protein n=1 Tax=Micrococcales TaxID=85006 RepID=UPI003B7C6D12